MVKIVVVIVFESNGSAPFLVFWSSLKFFVFTIGVSLTRPCSSLRRLLDIFGEAKTLTALLSGPIVTEPASEHFGLANTLRLFLLKVNLSELVNLFLGGEALCLQLVDVHVLKRVQLPRLVPHQLHALEVLVHDVRALLQQPILLPLQSVIVPVFISLVNDFVAAFHGAQFSNSQVFLKALEAF